MLLGEPPALLIHNTIANFSTIPDKRALKRSHNALAALQSERTQFLSQHQSALTELQRRLAAQESAYNLAVQSYNNSNSNNTTGGIAQHAAEMLKLDTEKFRVAKETAELEIEGERLEKELENARRSLEEVELEIEQGSGGAVTTATASASTPAKGPKAMNASTQQQLQEKEKIEDENEMTALKLRIFRALGIELEQDPKTGVYTKMIVRNRVKGDVKVVNVDPKISRYFYANYLWNCL